MLRDGGLGDAELALDDGDDIARTVFPFREQFQDATPDGIAEYIEGVHQVDPLESPV